MSTVHSQLKKGGSWKEFDVADIVPLPDYNAEGIWLRHRRTGMEVFHLFSSDPENLFAFAFKTPPDSSNGAAHILEHSVLCGSKRYPLKDPFIRLVNQSIKTFLNAMTFPDKTVYPASSLSEKDYFNVLSVYGDAVFFPLLDDMVFAQEAHRIELSPDGVPSVQGVVYNEMKGNYSSFDNVAADASVLSLFDGTPYLFDSGGDPAHITELTAEGLREFHRRYYHPGNCRLFLYGNIPTEKQLDFIEENFLSGFSAPPVLPVPAIPLSCMNGVPVRKEYPAPDPGGGTADKGCTVAVNWLTGLSENTMEYMESVYLAEALLGHDGAPLMRALLESGIGEDVSPNTGIETELRQIMFTAGLRGVPRDRAAEVEGLVLHVLEGLCGSGIPQAAVDAAVMSVDFANREVRRSGGPYSLVLMRRSLRGWLHGCPPHEGLLVRDAFEIIKKRLEHDPAYTADLIRSRLLENGCRSLTVVYPDAGYAELRAEKERAFAEKCTKDKTETEIRSAAEKLKLFQQAPDTEERCALLPHIRPSELSAEADKIQTECGDLGNGIPFFVSKEAANGVVYVDLGFPLDVLAPADFPLLPLFASCFTNTGYGGCGWAEAAERIALHTGGFAASLFNSSRADGSAGRGWLFLRIKTVAGHLEKAMEIAEGCITSAMFEDFDRLRDLAVEFRNEMDSSVIPCGHDYAASRASRLFSISKTTDEIWNGLSQVCAARELAAADAETLSSAFVRIRKKLYGGGVVAHMTAEESQTDMAVSVLSRFAGRCGLSAPVPCAGISFDELKKLTALPDASEGGGFLETIVVPTQVGFAAAAFRASPFGTKASAAESVLAHLLGNTALWERIRTVGGAYGAFALPDAMEHVFSFATFRDPKPFRSLKVFAGCLSEFGKKLPDKESVERAVTGSYSRLTQPKAPGGRGFTGFIRSLYGITEDMQEQRLSHVLSVSGPDIYEAAERLAVFQKEGNTAAVICGKPESDTGTIVRLSL